jgi:regulator of protease activity HflC (stomatin/prohibitin superfamily)
VDEQSERKEFVVLSPAIISAAIIVIYVLLSIKILREYGRGVFFRLEHVLPNPQAPGIILVLAPVDRMVRVSLRIDALDVPPQDVVTRDNVRSR